ncbi:MAG TPA: ribosomal RNA adenine dimethylase domain-containing protein [Lentisphaeria bacterium]|nr:MAG: hypothetical protein A2X47_06240 [Lentisphaerae bacterium GWF2_38_69]HBM15723.1 ribosomal RNA adenine dimethylase domain-containing protein [Lentisphaeria bacterium]
MSGISLLKNFIKSPQATGAIWPSSSFLSRAMISRIGIEKADSIVELGPGTGVITGYIIKHIKHNAKFFVVELSKGLCDIVQDKYPSVRIYNENAANLVKLKDGEEIEHIDLIISSLPWAAFPEHLQKSILDAIHASLKDGGIFTTFAYLQGALLPSGLKFKRMLKKYFRKVQISEVIWRNLPPAFVYRCTK